MRFIKLFSSTVCVLMAASACCAAQNPSARQGNSAIRILPQAAEISSPFATDAPSSLRGNSIAFLAADAMTPRDQEEVRAAAQAIRQRAALRGFDLEEGGWNYQQIACPVLPDEILLLYSRNRGVGDLSKFSAVVPRDGNGSVQVLPLLRRSYSLFTPARVNPMTIAAFNILREREHLGRKVDWLATGLCYAALAGVHVQLPPSRNAASQNAPSLVMNSLLQVEEDGSAVVRFFDIANPGRVNSWGLTFDRSGKLTSVEVTRLAGFKPAVIP